MAAVAYPWNALRGGFDLEMHPGAGAIMALADVLFWWLAVYLSLRLWRSWRN